MMRAGYFHDAHDASDDCAAFLTLLGQMLGTSGSTALSFVLNVAANPTHRFWAIGTPIEFKDILKRRGYRWNPGEDDRPRAWFKDIAARDCDTERAFLEAKIYQSHLGAPVVTAIDAFIQPVFKPLLTAIRWRLLAFSSATLPLASTLPGVDRTPLIAEREGLSLISRTVAPRRLDRRCS